MSFLSVTVAAFVAAFVVVPIFLGFFKWLGAYTIVEDADDVAEQDVDVEAALLDDGVGPEPLEEAEEDGHHDEGGDEGGDGDGEEAHERTSEVTRIRSALDRSCRRAFLM